MNDILSQIKEKNIINLINDNFDYLFEQTIYTSYEKELLILRDKLYQEISKFDDLTLYGKDEINMKEAVNNIYHIIVTNTDNKNNTFKPFLLFYYITSIISQKMYIGLDFEFNSRQIALMQINFEGYNSDSFIYIIDPRKFDKSIIEFMNKYILCNSKINKLLHGSDPLDIPYIYYELIGNKIANIKFTSKLFDTKYMCEYHNISNNLNQKCKIYEVLQNLKVITNNKYNQLIKNENKMGPLYKTLIDIEHISSEMISYALYDVLFLKYLYIAFLKQSKIHGTIIPELTRIMFLEKKEIINIINDIEPFVNEMNNYMIENYRLIDIYHSLIEEINIDLLQINYFKNGLTILFKFIIYYLLNKKYVIHKTKKIIFKKEIKTDILYDKLKALKFMNLIVILNQFKDNIMKTNLI